MQRGQALMGERNTFLGTCHMQLWMAAVPGTWKRGAREKLLHVKLSSLLPGYFCHMLVFTAFLLPPNDCTHSIYSTTYKTRSVSLVYAIKSLKFQEDAPGANADLCSFLLITWVSKWNCAFPEKLSFSFIFVVWKKMLLQLQCFPPPFLYISRGGFLFNSWTTQLLKKIILYVEG